MKIKAFLSTLLLCSMGAAANLELQGNFTQGGLLMGRVATGSTVTLNNEVVEVDQGGDFVIGFGRDAPLTHQLKINLANGETISRNIELSPRDYQIQRITGIKKSIMQPSAEDLTRIKKESAEIYMARQHRSTQPYFKQTPIWPATGPISGVYGSQRIYNGQPGRPHYGVDVAKPTGTKVVAPLSGVVMVASPDMFYSGGTIVIDHGFGLNTSYLHLSKLTVNVGDKVIKGDKIGEIGATGRSTGAHLDWRLNWGQVRLDPQLWAPPMN
ncbi:M23 family metallopeptidase [Paraferrimonas sp. SM1919]|uniref:M23 family metallopeptidase n=1 Tax=Paraferrimonas sp. SM1919 TaxID=2662263 RepID=UPI0013D01569|nr:M23 family metallopeptidase [Paraferrimonas sp. SM1919]